MAQTHAVRSILTLTVTLAASLFWVLVTEADAWAIPAFARQYGRDCQTCHAVFPKLTPFGEAFRRYGYRFPGDTDKTFSTADPVSLGREQYKKLFPHTVWPGVLPSRVPLAVQLGGSIDYQPAAKAEVDMTKLGGTLGVNFASNFGEVFSAWAGVTFRGDQTGAAEAELERVFAVVKPFDRPVLNLRIGRFEPEMWGFANHRTLGFSPWIMVTPIRDNLFTPHPAQNGIELTGVVARGRLAYSAGVVEGGGTKVNSFKDVYSRLGYKIGGMRLDGLEVGDTATQPWRETSLQFGGFGYFGQATVGDPVVASQEDRFFLVGGDAIATWRDVNVTVAGGYGRNQRPSLASPAQAVNHWQIMSQVDLVVYPWLVPTARYERRAIGDKIEQRVSGGAYVLIRANVRTQVLLSMEGDEDELAVTRALWGLNMVL